MTDDEVEALAIALYDSKLRTQLEQEHLNEFAAIEPISGSYYVGKTSLDAALAARSAWPDRLPFIVRIGHAVAHHIGSW
ncbi:MAG TPA: hypothetical protein VMP01_00325 [Pirellulaceae bacterium]|nr:hypothetical protein [Pirellulaceae bacterium]